MIKNFRLIFWINQLLIIENISCQWQIIQAVGMELPLPLQRQLAKCSQTPTRQGRVRLPRRERKTYLKPGISGGELASIERMTK